jgi:hypothetical protein
MQSDIWGEKAGLAMAEYYRARAKYRERKTKRGAERLRAKEKRVGELLRKSVEAQKTECRLN